MHVTNAKPNAALQAHPKLAAALLSSNALAVMREIEVSTHYTCVPSSATPLHAQHHSLATLHVGGSKLAECAQTALYRLTTNQEGDKNLAHKKYRFKVSTRNRQDR
jgi:serine/threonine protein phosphatase PrpC